MNASKVFPLLARLGFAAWFGAGLWFGAFGAQALFRALGADVATALAALFPSIFGFGVACGLAALIGSLGDGGGRHRVLRLAAAAVVTASALVDLLVLDHLVAASVPGTPAFAATHAASVLVALVGWLAAVAGLMAEA